MSNKLSSTEVLSCLNELGFTNITVQQLKEFMYDLKRLLRYEEKQLERSREISVNNLEACSKKVDEIFHNLYAHGTVESRAKMTRKGNIITVQIRRPKTTKSTHCHQDKEQQVSQEFMKSGKTQGVMVEKEIQTDSVCDAKHDIQGIQTDVAKRKVAKPRPKSFIRKPIQVQHKSDPVALFQKYQEEWKKIKLPGEDNRAELRWAIREKLLGNIG